MSTPRPTLALGVRERQVLLSVLDVRGGPLGEAAIGADWSAIERVARDGKILPALAHRVISEGVDVPGPVRERLRDALQETAVYNTRLLAELARIAELLRGAGIDCAALKGAALMARHYPHLAQRHAVDLDLLVDPERFHEAIARLRAAGYGDAPHTAALGFDGRSFASALRAPHLHAYTPLCGPSGVNLDLHRRVPTRGFEAGGGFGGWRARAQAVPVGTAQVLVSCERDLALHLCEHFALQHHCDPSDAPRLLCDLRAMFPAEPDWASFSHGSPAERVAVAVARRLYRAAFALEPAPPRSARAQLQRIAIADPAVAPPLAAISSALEHVERFVRDLAERPGYALHKLVPAASYMQERYGVARGTPRFYARYAGRLLRDPLRVLRRRASSEQS